MNAGLLVTLLVGGLGIGGTVGYVVGVDKGKAQGMEVVGSGTASQGESPGLFIVNSKIYRQDQLDSELQNRLFSADKESFHKKESMLKEYSLRLALAADKGMAGKELPPLEELLPKATVTDKQMKEFFEQNKSRLPPDAKFEDFKPRLEQFLMRQEQAKVFQDTYDKYASDGKIKLLVKHPVAPIVSIPTDRFPQMGNAKAANVLVEVSDYLCPHCQQTYTQVKGALKELGDSVKLIQVNFSLRPSKLSGSIIEGAYCASQQGNDQFWKYHEVAFQPKWGSMNDAADLEKPKEIAKEAGIDVAKMEACLKEPAAKAFVKETSEIASSLGVTGTPTFFLNNRRLALGHGKDFLTSVKEEIANKNTN
ncbi:MAG: thioredoxin domain-containing protein [Pseudobacteriovorax sp.]|nr:thioredoxin domain-containing protein [Pseudobacteriovorax sp.]